MGVVRLGKNTSSITTQTAKVVSDEEKLQENVHYLESHSDPLVRGAFKEVLAVMDHNIESSLQKAKDAERKAGLAEAYTQISSYEKLLKEQAATIRELQLNEFMEKELQETILNLKARNVLLENVVDKTRAFFKGHTPLSHKIAETSTEYPVDPNKR